MDDSATAEPLQDGSSNGTGAIAEIESLYNITPVEGASDDELDEGEDSSSTTAQPRRSQNRVVSGMPMHCRMWSENALRVVNVSPQNITHTPFS
jgi:hypothetical protein